jgi:hypothetical protein
VAQEPIHWTETIGATQGRPSPGAATHSLSEAERKKVVVEACRPPKDAGFPITHWSMSLLGEHLRKQGYAISDSTAGRILRAEPLQPHRQKMWVNSHDHPPWTRHFTPKHASWLNQIEDAFSILGRRVVDRGSFTSKEDLREKLYSYMIWHNRNGSPFHWSYRPKSWSNNAGQISDRRH